jgi:hypothetical protein
MMNTTFGEVVFDQYGSHLYGERFFPVAWAILMYISVSYSESSPPIIKILIEFVCKRRIQIDSNDLNIGQ